MLAQLLHEHQSDALAHGVARVDLDLEAQRRLFTVDDFVEYAVAVGVLPTRFMEQSQRFLRLERIAFQILVVLGPEEINSAVDHFAETEEHAFNDQLSVGHVGHRLANSFVAENRMVVVPADVGVCRRVVFVFFELALEALAVGAAHHLDRLQAFHVIEAAAFELGQRRIHVVHDAKLQPIEVRLIDAFFAVAPIIWVARQLDLPAGFPVAELIRAGAERACG